MMKRLFYRFYPILGTILLIVGVATIVTLGPDEEATLIAGLVAGVLGCGYFVQQQRLAETHLFKELFTEFNKRYDNLNNRLTALSPTTQLNEEQRQVVVDYYNLCAEEYLFYREGYILPHVWQAWCRGMLQYLDREPFRSVWRKELESGSYYGLSEAAVRAGAS